MENHDQQDNAQPRVAEDAAQPAVGAAPGEEKVAEQLPTIAAEAAPVQKQDKPAPNVESLGPALKDIGDKWDENGDITFFLNDTPNNTAEAVVGLPNMDATNPADSELIGLSLAMGEKTMPELEQWVRTIARPGSTWTQAVKSETGPLGINRPAFKDPGKKLTGEKGMLHIRTLMGLGSIAQVPLWHSGFWISFKAPSAAALLELDRRIAEEKVTLGRRTQGLLFANNSVFFNTHLIEFALAHVFDTTLKDSSDLKKKIRVLDIPILIWGLACTVWPDGFQYARTVVVDDGEEKRLELRRGKTALGKMLITDYHELTKAQIRHMSNHRNKDMTDQSLEAYLAEFDKTENGAGRNKVVKIAEDVEVELAVCTVEDYLRSGTNWINNIVHMIDNTFQLPPNDPRRNRYIDENGKATYLRQYAHLIKAIRFNVSSGDPSIVDEPDDVDDALEILSENREISKNYFEEVVDFLENATVALIGIPVETQEDREQSYPRFENYLPLDPASVFFIRLQQTTAQVRAR